MLKANIFCKVIFVLLFLFLIVPALAQVDTAWVRRYNRPGNGSDEALAIAVDGSGNVYVTGASYDSGTGSDYATIKYDPNGNELWVKRYDGPGDNADYSYAIALDGSGNVYVTGYSYGSGTSGDYATIKYDNNGNQLWIKRYNGPGNSDDGASAIALDGSGNVYVTGRSYDNGTNYDYATIKYDNNGNQLWIKRYNGPGNSDDVTSAIVLDGSGNAYVTGYSYGSGTYYDYATIKYDNNGNQLWVKRYNGPGNIHDVAYDIGLDGSGNVYVTGGSYGSGTSWDYATIKYDPNGNELLVKTYNGPGNDVDEAHGIALDSSGNVYVTGGSYGSGTSRDYATIKYVQTKFSTGIRLTFIAKEKDNTDVWNSYNPGNLDSVDVGDHLKFQGIAIKPDSTPFAKSPIIVYNSFNFNPGINKTGIDTIHTDSSGYFVYPPQDTGVLCTVENFWPFWFAMNDSTATPYLLTVGKGCPTCSEDSVVEHLRQDTSIFFDALGSIDDQNVTMNCPK